MKILNLPLRKEFYEMIECGEKREDYRECKAYWYVRLCIDGLYYRHFDAVRFSYGYTRRRMTFECCGITIGRGRPEWGAPDDATFIIKLGKRL